MKTVNNCSWVRVNPTILLYLARSDKISVIHRSRWGLQGLVRTLRSVGLTSRRRKFRCRTMIRILIGACFAMVGSACVMQE